MAKAAKSNAEDYIRMYKQMVRIRTFEDSANQLYLDAKMPGLTHMYSGQEAVAVGICEALEKTDYITSTHRGHGHCVAKGAQFKEMFCELLGKADYRRDLIRQQSAPATARWTDIWRFQCRYSQVTVSRATQDRLPASRY